MMDTTPQDDPALRSAGWLHYLLVGASFVASLCGGIWLIVVFDQFGTAANVGLLRFAGLVHHTDAEREYAYDRESKVGKLDKALDEATAKGWAIVDMKQDWKIIFPPEK